MFSDYAPSTDQENRPPYNPNQYPWKHIHPTARGFTTQMADTSRSPQKRRPKSALATPDGPPPEVRPLQGPKLKQEIGYGPYHQVKADAKRFDFSKPRTAASSNRTISEINPPPSSVWAARKDMDLREEENPIKLFHGNYEENAQRHRGRRAQNVQSENNDPLSAHAHVHLERFAREDGNGIIEASIQPHISAGYIQRQTQQMMASKRERLEEYHRSVQERLNRRVEQEKAQERQRRAKLPEKVKSLVYSIKATNVGSTNSTSTSSAVQEDQASVRVHRHVSPTVPAQQQQQPQPHNSFIPSSHPSQFTTQPSAAAPPQSLEEFKSRGSPSKHIQERETRETSPVGTRFRSLSEERERERPRTAGGASIARRSAGHVQLSKAESVAYLTQVRKLESEKSRARVRAAREAGFVPQPDCYSTTGMHSARSHHIAFGTSGLFPRDAAPIAAERLQGDERDLVARERRNPRGFVVQQQLGSEEPVQEEEKVLHVPNPSLAASKKMRMSNAVAGKVSKKKKRPAAANQAGQQTAGEKNSVYRRLVLERLHALAQTLGHPLPPLCACGFTPKEEYELLFSYGGITTTSAQPPVQHSQPPFNLSTVIQQTPVDSSIHTHTHAPSTANQPTLASHVTVDRTRHGFQHKHNCQYHGQPQAYVAALANLLHTLEDQQQI